MKTNCKPVDLGAALRKEKRRANRLMMMLKERDRIALQWEKKYYQLSEQIRQGKHDKAGILPKLKTRFGSMWPQDPDYLSRINSKLRKQPSEATTLN